MKQRGVKGGGGGGGGINAKEMNKIKLFIPIYDNSYNHNERRAEGWLLMRLHTKYKPMNSMDQQSYWNNYKIHFICTDLCTSNCIQHVNKILLHLYSIYNMKHLFISYCSY